MLLVKRICKFLCWQSVLVVALNIREHQMDLPLEVLENVHMEQLGAAHAAAMKNMNAVKPAIISIAVHRKVSF